jgi:KDO2-lipid IV(A) lauroyltransferase
MSKPHSRVLDYTVYLAVRFLMCVIQMVSYQTACRWAGGLAWLLYRIDRRHRLVADDNLRLAFGPGYTEEQRDQVVRAIYRHLCTLLIDFVFLQRKLHVHTFRQNLDLTGAWPIADAFLSDQPFLMVTGHLGNWEVGSFSMGVLGLRTAVVARTLDNPYLDRLLRSLRERSGQTVLDKNQDYERIQKGLASNGCLGTLADQDAGKRGVFVNFFGRPASTHKAIALLALEYRARILVAATVKRGYPGKYDVLVADTIHPDDYANRPDAVAALTQRFTTALESLIRLAPEQYFWVHRRWKSQPPVRRSARTPAAPPLAEQAA